MNYSDLLQPLLLSAVISSVVSVFFYLVFSGKNKKALQKAFEEKWEEQQATIQAYAEESISNYKNQLAIQNSDDLEAYRAALKNEYEQKFQAVISGLKKSNEFEIEVLKTKFKNIQPSYPRKIEANQKLVVLTNTIVPSSGSNPREDYQFICENFELIEDQILKFLLSYAGIIDKETEAILHQCAQDCAAGKKETKGTGFSHFSYELAEKVAQQLVQAKQHLKKETSLKASI